MVRASSIRTTIHKNDLEEFKNFLIAKGLVHFTISEVAATGYLNLYFENSAEIMKYKLKGMEAEYRSTRRDRYFYDMHDAWGEEQTKDFFGDEGY